MRMSQVLHRRHGGCAADYKTLSLPLPDETIKMRRPDYGDRTFLHLVTGPEDDPSIPTLVCISIPWSPRQLNTDSM